MNIHYLNGKQYPYGYKTWIWNVCKELDLKDKNHYTAYSQLDLDAWLIYFNDGLSPKDAVLEDFKNQ